MSETAPSGIANVTSETVYEQLYRFQFIAHELTAVDEDAIEDQWAVCIINSWNRTSNGFSKRASVKREKPRPSSRRITQAPGRSRSEWKTSRARIRLSISSGLVVAQLLAPVPNLETPLAKRAYRRVRSSWRANAVLPVSGSPDVFRSLEPPNLRTARKSVCFSATRRVMVCVR